MGNETNQGGKRRFPRGGRGQGRSSFARGGGDFDDEGLDDDYSGDEEFSNFNHHHGHDHHHGHGFGLGGGSDFNNMNRV